MISPSVESSRAAGQKHRGTSRRKCHEYCTRARHFTRLHMHLGKRRFRANYPDRPITLVVAFPPGGADDAIARIIHEPMEHALGQPIVIENIGGAGGMIAAAKAARAAPDGYTILLHQDALAAAMTMYSNRTFDAEGDFVAIGLINMAATTLAPSPTLPPNNFDEFLSWMKQPEQNIKFGHPGIGSAPTISRHSRDLHCLSDQTQ